MTMIKAINRVVDHELIGYRSRIFRYSPAIQATVIITAVIRSAIAWFESPAGVIRALIDVAEGDLTRNGPPRLLTSFYTEREAMACAISEGKEAALATRIVIMLVSEMELLRSRLGSEIGDRADYCLMRRIIASLLRTVPAEVLLDCVDGLSKADIMVGRPMILLTPESLEPKDRVRAKIEDFWRTIGDLPWTQDAYWLLLRSGLITACRRLRISTADVAGLLENDDESRDRFLAIDEFEPGDVASVAGVIDLSRFLADCIVTLAQESAFRSEVIVAKIAALLSPLEPMELGRQLSARAPEWEKDLPEELGANRLALVVGEGPALIV